MRLSKLFVVLAAISLALGLAPSASAAGSSCSSPYRLTAAVQNLSVNYFRFSGSFSRVRLSTLPLDGSTRVGAPPPTKLKVTYGPAKTTVYCRGWVYFTDRPRLRLPSTTRVRSYVVYLDLNSTEPNRNLSKIVVETRRKR